MRYFYPRLRVSVTPLSLALGLFLLGCSSGSTGPGSENAVGGGSSTCPVGLQPCTTGCVDVANDNSNCGSCGVACTSGQTCVGGSCVCATGQALCGGTCVDTQANVSNCGSCGVTCEVPLETCTAGSCVCASGYLDCGAGCTNTQADAANCGACGTVCVSPQVCSLGACSATCADGLTACNQACVNLTNDPLNCGTCGTTCGAGQSCQNSQCQCSPGLLACNGACVDPQLDNANCGICGNLCGAGQSCMGGVCTCVTAGQTACGNTCTNLAIDSQNCGTCGTVCPSGICTAGVCEGGSAGTGGATATGEGGATATGEGGATATGAGGATATGAGGATATDAGGATGTTAGGATGTTGGATGTGGTTDVTCDPGLLLCYGACIDPLTDVANCGECGNSCAAGVCNAGVCPTVKTCFKKTAVTSSLFTDFESYDGTTDPGEWGFAFNGESGSETAVYAGSFFSNDGTGTPTMSMLAGQEGVYSLNIANTMASDWGGALGFWMQCIDATAWQGISLWVKGSSPTGTVNFGLSTEDTSAPDEDDPAGGGTCTADCVSPSYDVPLTTTWTNLLIPWASFTPGQANGAEVPVTGDNITGLNFAVPMEYAEDPSNPGTWIPAPGAFDFSVDDIQFIGDGACLTGLELCGVGCVDLASDENNCGTCGTVCDVNRSCVSGSCTCAEGYTECGTECVNTAIDVQHCGGCNTPCTGECSGGTCQASTCTSGMPHQGETCVNAEKVTVGKYYVFNNQWGTEGGVTGNQCVWSTCESGNTVGWGTEWSWSGGSASQVKGYPSIVYGWHWTDASSLGILLNRSATTAINCGWTFDVNQDGTMNVAYDLFTHTMAAPGYSNDPADEIMIWLYAGGGAGPIGSQVGTVSVAGASWNLYSGNNGYWNVRSYVRTSNTTSATFNLMDFLKDLMERNLLTEGKYLSSIEAGTEIFNGTGTLDTSSFYCTIN